MTLERMGERLARYRDASVEERRAMIADHYAQLRAEARARYELRHGPGSIERRQAELAALPPAPLSLGGGQARGYWGRSRGGVWS